MLEIIILKKHAYLQKNGYTPAIKVRGQYGRKLYIPIGSESI
ncbi:hypothetical protein HMPREF3213_01850 [Heyndrickxia coagulans]|uniref:Uncharacterized protein n=1 Tax=Heyndrickxia coagulans TaxID=1398 RepID=A0A133KQN6_HEYCO|nr:hypothetical protein HMPREF3213_01850 [Heyndrickxia coagulans]